MKLAAGALVVTALALTTTTPARAEVVTDGPFSIDIKGADVCVVAPAALRGGAHCEGIALPDMAAIDALLAPAKMRPISVGILRAPNGGPAIGVVQVIHKPGENVWPDQRIADELAKSYAKDAVTEVGGAARPRVSDVRVVHNGDTRVMRATIDIDDGPATPEAQAAEHHEIAATFTRNGVYLLLILSPRAEAATLRAVADESVPTIALDAAARPGKDVGEALGRLFVYVAMAIAGAAIYLSRKRTKARQEAWLRQQEAAQHPPPHYPQPPPGPHA